MRSAVIVLVLEVALLIGLFIARGPIQQWHLQKLCREVTQTIATDPTNVERQLERLKEAASTYGTEEATIPARQLIWECWLFGIGKQAGKFDYLEHEYDNIWYWSDGTFRNLLEAPIKDFTENLNENERKWHRIRLPETWGACLKHLQETAPALLKTIAEHPEQYSTVDVGRLDGAMQTLKAPERLDVLRAFAKRNSWRATRALYDMLQDQPQEREAELKALAEGGNPWARKLLGKSQTANKPINLESEDLEALTRYGLTAQGSTKEQYLERAAEAGWVPAYSALGQYDLNNNALDRAGRWLRLSAAHEDVKGYFLYALYCWATMPDNVNWGNRSKMDTAIKDYLLWAKRASDQGYALASCDLGRILLVGIYTVDYEETILKADPEAARRYFQLSKIQGSQEADSWLYYYENPPEAPFASNMTLQWTLGHARAGNAEAQYQIGVDRLANMDKVQKKAESEEEAVKWLKRAVEQKHGNAAYRLWKFYEKKRDWQTASTYRDFAKQYNSELYEEEMERTSQKSKPVSTPKKREQSNAEREMFNLLWSL